MSREREPLVVGRVIGDVIDPFVRTTALSVSYRSREVTNGREFKPSQVVNQPRVEVGGDDLRTLYTLVRTSVHRIKAKSPMRRATSRVSHGQEVISYESPRPTLGIHRFVFVLFRQLGRQTVYTPGWRQSFNTRDFAELYNLGSPVAAVFFNCQREAGSGGRRMYPM
ncbi:hypothetical protein BHE74_00056017 [Ensete ventricosum]|uniref:Uncharacterized protein n=1 Tax=Ensete ventricosum TaxID=4639 RepID=A0A426ZK98_ENSVE|nr:hypothetical protein B296_00018919 [Ensete ventricosum]RWW38735.1 hypothetical protein BHE74_00056017 [Ensete ventricosum]